MLTGINHNHSSERVLRNVERKIVDVMIPAIKPSQYSRLCIRFCSDTKSNLVVEYPSHTANRNGCSAKLYESTIEITKKLERIVKDFTVTVIPSPKNPIIQNEFCNVQPKSTVAHACKQANAQPTIKFWIETMRILLLIAVIKSLDSFGEFEIVVQTNYNVSLLNAVVFEILLTCQVKM